MEPGTGRGCSSQARDCMYIDENEDPCKLLKSQYAKYLEEEQAVIWKSDLSTYLHDCEKASDAFDFLDGWKINSQKYPILSRLARGLLTIPVCKIVPSSRSSLPPHVVEALVCAQNYLRPLVING